MQQVQWQNIVPAHTSSGAGVPKGRSLHSGVTIGDSLYIFGGYDGTSRLNDLHRFDFSTSSWTHVTPSTPSAPSPRDRLAAAVCRDSLYMFGGFDGVNRVCDLWRFDPLRAAWTCIAEFSGTPPSARHSHSAVCWDGKFFVLFGYDGNYKSDVHEFNMARKTWIQLRPSGAVPKPRYRSTVVVYEDRLFVFGGHDGTKHLDDLHELNMRTMTWSLVEPSSSTGTIGPYQYRSLTPVASSPPPARDSHSAVVHGDSLFVFGGSSGAPRNDLYEYRIDLNSWMELHPSIPNSELDEIPCARFCHIAVVHRDCMLVHAGYDGQHRLSDLKSYSFTENVLLDVPPPTILADLAAQCNQPEFADVTIDVDGTTFWGHKIILGRCMYFRAMFSATCNMQEKRKDHVEIKDIDPNVFNAVLWYIYTDEVAVSQDSGDDFVKGDFIMSLLCAADRFGIDRLKKICEQSILSSISVDSASTIFQAADSVGAQHLRKRAMDFMLRNYDAVVKTAAFEELARRNIELTLEIIRLH